MSKESVKRPFAVVAILLATMLALLCGLTACGNARGNDKPTQYTVTYYSNGGSEVPSQVVSAGTRTLKPRTPVREGYTLVGWFTDGSLTDEWDFDEGCVNSDITLYAKWKKNPVEEEDPPSTSKCAVTFDSNGGSNVQSQTIDVGGKVTRPPDPTRAGYTFKGWYSNIAMTAEWDFDTAVSGTTLTLYAKWERNATPVTQCTVTFDSNGGSNVQSQTIEVGGKVTRPPDPTRTGYTFKGWYSNSALTAEWNFNTAVSGTTLTLYAKWERNVTPVTQCTVTFKSNGGSSVQSQTIEVGGKVTRPTNPTRTGYTFVDWFSDSDCTVLWNFDAAVSGATLTLYAKWRQNGAPIENYTVTFNVGLEARKNGLSNPAAQTVPSGSKITAPSVTISGYTLSGWYAEDKGAAWNFSTNTVTKNITLYARFTGSGSNTYTPPTTMRESNTLYIHYLRNSNDYASGDGGWCLWVWSTGNGTRFTYNTIDQSGAVYKIPLSSYGSAATINFKAAIISSSGTWGTEDGGNCSVKLSDAAYVGGSYHWYVKQGATATGSSSFMPNVSGNLQTETLRASRSDVNRSYAQGLSVMPTATNWDDVGVGYQIFVASFCDSDGDGVGDLQGIINKLDYLSGLNVDVLWLTPIQSSNSYHGYDCYDYYCIDGKFGTNADYRELVYKAHQKGMRVIMDLVVNHTSPNNEWFIKSQQGVVETVTYQDGTTKEVHYRDFYRWNNSGGDRKYDAGDGWYYYSSFGSSMPELNYDCQAVRDGMADVAAYWMNFGLDGFRLDAIKHIFMSDESTNAGGDRIVGSGSYMYNLNKDIEVFKEFNYKLKTKYPSCFIVGEQLDGNADNVAPFYAGMDSLFDFNMFYHQLENNDSNNYINRGNVSGTVSDFNNNANKYASARGSGNRAINSMISSNHDIPRLSSYLNTEKSKLYFAVMMTMPGLSWIYYGDEIGLKGDGARGDGDYRQSMKWTSNWAYECHNDISKKDLNTSTVSVANQESDSGSLLNYVKSLTKLRSDYPALISGTATCSNENGMLKIVVTKSGEKTLTIYHNYSSSSKTVSSGDAVVFGSKSLGGYGTVVLRAN